MTEMYGSRQPDPDWQIFFNWFPNEINGRQCSITWTWGEGIAPGFGTDDTELYIAPDSSGIPQWWRRINEETVGMPEGEPELLSFDEVLSVIEPAHWPMLYCWTVDCLANFGWEKLPTERWNQLTKSDPTAQEKLKDLLVALMPEASE